MAACFKTSLPLLSDLVQIYNLSVLWSSHLSNEHNDLIGLP